MDDMTGVARHYQSELNADALAWLKARGLNDSTIKRAMLGYVATPVNGQGRFVNSIAIPYLNPDGSVRSMRFRYLKPYKHKYDSLKGKGVHIYGVANTARRKVWVSEGEFDALILNQMGFPAVGLPGANSFKTEWKYLFVNCEQVSLVMDSDEAGERAANRLASILGDVVDDLRLLRLPEGQDVTDTYLRNPSALAGLIE